MAAQAPGACSGATFLPFFAKTNDGSSGNSPDIFLAFMSVAPRTSHVTPGPQLKRAAAAALERAWQPLVRANIERVRRVRLQRSGESESLRALCLTHGESDRNACRANRGQQTTCKPDGECPDDADQNEMRVHSERECEPLVVSCRQFAARDELAARHNASVV